MLGSITVMHIPVKNGYFLKIVFVPEILYPDCDVVIDAESINYVACSAVMARRSNNCESITPSFAYDIVNSH